MAAQQILKEDKILTFTQESAGSSNGKQKKGEKRKREFIFQYFIFSINAELSCLLCLLLFSDMNENDLTHIYKETHYPYIRNSNTESVFIDMKHFHQATAEQRSHLKALWFYLGLQKPRNLLSGELVEQRNVKHAEDLEHSWVI